MTPAPAIVLVRPQLGVNIGAAARAMLNFGLTRMRLVAPRDGWPNEEARAMASRADAVLDAAELYPETDAAIGDLHRVFAASARGRDMLKPVMTPRRAAAEARQAIAAGQRVGFLFGPERAGLDNADMVRADAVVAIPANPDFASVNLAQAVLLIAYEWFLAGDERPGFEPVYGRSRPASKAELDHFLRHFEEELDQSGHFDTVADKRPAMIQNLRNMWQRADLTEQDLRSLHGIIRALSGNRQGHR